MRQLIILTLLLSISTNFNPAKAEIVDLLDSAESFPEEEITNYDQPLRTDYNLRQIQNAFNESNPNSNIKNYIHNPNQIYKVKLRLHINTLIYLPKGEEILAYSLGDNTSFAIQSFQNDIPNLLNVKSLFSGVDTNLIVITKSQNKYAFYLRSYDVKSNHLPDFIVNISLPKDHESFYFTKQHQGQNKQKNTEESFPQTTLKAKKTWQTKQDKISKQRISLLKQLQKDNDYLKSIKDPDRINVNYEIFAKKEDKEIAPFGIYDDGKWTYFDFRKDFSANRLPVLYKVIDEYDTIINTRFENGFLIAESISKEGWTLKNGDKVACIKPKDNLAKNPQEKMNFWGKIKGLFGGGDNAK